MKVLVIRFSSIGDIVLTSPVLRWLSTQKNAEVHYLTKQAYDSLVKHNPHVQKIYLLQDEIADTINELKEEGYDLVIDLHKNLRSKKVSKALNCEYITFNKLNIRKWLFVNFKINVLPKKHIIDRYAEALDVLGLDTADRSMEYHFPHQYAFDLTAYNLKPKHYICIVIGGTYTTKQIPESIILSLIKRLKQPIAMLGGGKQDEIKAQKISEQCGSQVINLVNKISLIDSAYVIQKSAGIITSDTGLMHIASAFDIPIHTLWGNTHPDFGMYAYRVHNTEINNYNVNLKCQPCSKLGSDLCPRAHFSCMLNQNVEQIVKNCESTDAAQ